MIKRLDFSAKVQVSFNLASNQDIQSQNDKFQNSLTFVCPRCTMFTVRLQCIMKKAWSFVF